MAHTSPTHTCLYGSLFALVAATVVSGVALTGWVHGISDRLYGTVDESPFPEDRIIGSLDETEANIYVAPAPVAVRRPATERLPSQMPPPDETYLDVYGNTTPADIALTDDVPDDPDAAPDVVPIENSNTSEMTQPTAADTLATQAAILDEMRRSSADAVALSSPAQ